MFHPCGSRLNRSLTVATGIGIVACVATFNYMQLNRNGNAPHLLTVLDAKASANCGAIQIDAICVEYTPDGLEHVCTNCEVLQ